VLVDGIGHVGFEGRDVHHEGEEGEYRVEVEKVVEVEE